MEPNSLNSLNSLSRLCQCCYPLEQSTRLLSMFCSLWCNPPGPCRCFSSYSAIHSTTVDVLAPLMQSARPLSMFWPLDAIRSAPVGVLTPLMQFARPLSMFWPLWCNPPGPCRCFDPLMQFARPLSMFWLLDAIRSAPVGVCPSPLGASRQPT